MVKRPKPSENPEAREKQIINAAMNLAEEQILKGTAAASVIVHFLKLGSERAKLEKEVLDSQATLARAKADSITKAKDDETLAQEAINALKGYQPSE